MMSEPIPLLILQWILGGRFVVGAIVPFFFAMSPAQHFPVVSGVGGSLFCPGWCKCVLHCIKTLHAKYIT